jgi:hypothetical protein
VVVVVGATVVVVVVVVVVTGVWQFTPVKPGGQLQLYPRPMGVQVPPFRHGLGVHGWGRVVVVVVVVVVLVLVVDDVVVDVVAVVVVVGFSQLMPDDPGGQTQRYPLESVARQMPPLKHGFGLHGWGRVVLVVVVPAVHTAEPGGADVPGGHAVQEVAAPTENVSAGQTRQSDEPAKGA